MPPKDGSRVKVLNTLLVDGNALFKTGYFGAKSEYNRQGEHVGGVYQFITVLRKLLNEDLYHQVYVFWDGKLSGKLRWEIYKEYNLLHRHCPECGSGEITSTCIGFMFIDLETAYDSNKADCVCGWEGIVHNLVSSEKIKAVGV